MKLNYQKKLLSIAIMIAFAGYANTSLKAQEIEAAGQTNVIEFKGAQGSLSKTLVILKLALT